MTNFERLSDASPSVHSFIMQQLKESEFSICEFCVHKRACGVDCMDEFYCIRGIQEYLLKEVNKE